MSFLSPMLFGLAIGLGALITGKGLPGTGASWASSSILIAGLIVMIRSRNIITHAEVH